MTFLIAESLASRASRGLPAAETIRPEYAAWRTKADHYTMQRQLSGAVGLVACGFCEKFNTTYDGLQLRFPSGYYPSWVDEHDKIDMPPLTPCPVPNEVRAMDGIVGGVWWGKASRYPAIFNDYTDPIQERWEYTDISYAAMIARNWAQALSGARPSIGLDKFTPLIREEPQLAAELVRAMLDATADLPTPPDFHVEPVNNDVAFWWVKHFQEEPHASRVRGYRMLSNKERKDGTDKWTVEQFLRFLKDVAQPAGFIVCGHVMTGSGITADEMRGLVAAEQNGTIDLVVSRHAAANLAAGEDA